MREFWTRYFLDNGQRMSQRQVKKVKKLEEEILDCMTLIDRLESIIIKHSKEIERLKHGGENKAECVSNNDFKKNAWLDDQA